MKLINLNRWLRLFGQDFLKMINLISLSSLLGFPGGIPLLPQFPNLWKIPLVNKRWCLLGKEFLVPRLSPLFYLGNLLWKSWRKTCPGPAALKGSVLGWGVVILLLISLLQELTCQVEGLVSPFSNNPFHLVRLFLESTFSTCICTIKTSSPSDSLCCWWLAPSLTNGSRIDAQESSGEELLSPCSSVWVDVSVYAHSCHF